MIIKPKVKGFICVNAHPLGCQKALEAQILQAENAKFSGPKTALIIGCSSGYGLASRVALAFGSGTDTLGVHFDREPSKTKTASAGWYNNQHLEKLARKQGLAAHSINVDAFQDEAKSSVIELIKKTIKTVDLVIYSVAAPRRFIASEDKIYSSVLKPIGEGFQSKTINTDKGIISNIELEAASQDEIDATVKVMGGEDWQQWMVALKDADVLSETCKTVAYTYRGDEITKPIYGEATIGRAKEDLDRASSEINTLLSGPGSPSSTSKIGAENQRAYIGVLKALVTQSSAAIPVMPLYISLLYKVMKQQGVHESCFEQIVRMLSTGLYGDSCKRDSVGRLRVDEFELADDIQQEVKSRWNKITNENLQELSDFEGYRREFLQLFGFHIEGIDYEADIASTAPYTPEKTQPGGIR